MPETQIRVTFQPQGRAVYVLAGANLLEAAARAGLTIDTPCGGGGTCGKCRLQITSGEAGPCQADRDHFSDEQLSAGWRLACQTALSVDATVHVPPESLFADQHQILTELGDTKAAHIAPVVRKVFLKLTAPDGLEGLATQLGDFVADKELLEDLASKLTGLGGEGTALLAGGNLVDLEPGDSAGRCFGVAIDVGTTTLVGSLLDLQTGDELAVASAINPQTSFGDDVLSRINYASTDPDKLAGLQKSVSDAIGEILEDLSSQAQIAREEICELTFAGNTTMQQLLAGLDVSGLGTVPFAPAVTDSQVLAASELGIPIHPGGPGYIFPVIGGFVGGDTVAGLVATGLDEAVDGPVLMIDIGTNGEIVLAHDGKLQATSTAAGPAFEGARISCGMRATRGAIEKVVIDEDVHCNVIGNAKPVGLCGSGLVDAAAGLLECGIITEMGRLLGPDDLPETVGESLRKRVRKNEAGRAEFVLAWDGPDGAIALSEGDIRELQLAVGAIRAGITILLSRAGLTGPDLSAVLIAGGFGSFIRRSCAQRIGLLPADVDHTRMRYIGNASLDGARLALLSRDVRNRVERVARLVEHVDLSQDMQFQMVFAESMIFPT